MSAVRRWVLTDPFDTNPATNTYTFPRNPSSMTSVFPTRQVSSMSTSAGKILLYEGQTPTTQWEFSGMVLSKTQLDSLHAWVYKKRRRVVLNDHFGRNITLVFTGMDAVPRRRVNYYYSHDYTVTALILGVTTPTVIVPNGPLA